MKLTKEQTDTDGRAFSRSVILGAYICGMHARDYVIANRIELDENKIPVYAVVPGTKRTALYFCPCGAEIHGVKAKMSHVCSQPKASTRATPKPSVTTTDTSISETVKPSQEAPVAMTNESHEEQPGASPTEASPSIVPSSTETPSNATLTATHLAPETNVHEVSKSNTDILKELNKLFADAAKTKGTNPYTLTEEEIARLNARSKPQEEAGTKPN